MARQKRAPQAPEQKAPSSSSEDAPKTAAETSEPKEQVQAPKAEGKPKAQKVPESVTLSAPHGFIDEDGSHRYWHAGHVVTDPEHVALLIKRKAPLDGIDHDEA